MGGIAVNDRMQTRVAGLVAAGEASGGANSANRLSGNAITEALVSGEGAGFFPPGPRWRSMLSGHPHLSSGLVRNSPSSGFNLDLQDWDELKAMLRCSEAVVMAALNRAESRGAHQRLDFPQTIAEFERNQLLSLEDGTLTSRPIIRDLVTETAPADEKRC
jgi:succinate dehydrogenase/fumarate reductase flavoprotein subunit